MNSVFAQHINFGLTGGFTTYQKIKWERAIHHPENSYLTYIEKDYGKGLLNKNSVLSGINYGAFFEGRYRRFAVSVEPQYYYQKVYLFFEKPFLIERNIGKRAFRLPLVASYKLFKGGKSPFVLAGINFTKEKNWDFHSLSFEYYFQGDQAFQSQFETGDDHFNGMLYDDSAYFSYIFGIGTSGKKWSSSIRFQREMAITKHHVEASIWQIELSVNLQIISTKDFTKKHFLYVEE